MANEVLSGTLATLLNQTVVSAAFEIARSNRTGLLAIAGFGGSRDVYDGYKTDWLEMRVDATGSATTAAMNNSVTTAPVTDGSKFRVGMMVSAVGSDEVMLVTAVSSNNLTVVRGIGTTTAAAITSGTVINIDSVGREENSLAANDTIAQPDRVSNYFQTMDTAIEMSRRSLATYQYGDTNDLAFQVELQMRQLATQMDRALIRGQRLAQTIAGNVHTYTGGLNYFLDQTGAIKTDHAAAALTLKAVENLNAEIITRGGQADTIVVGIGQARRLNDLVGANYSSQRLADWSNDQGSLTRLPSDIPLVGSVTNIVIDTNIGANELILLDSNRVSVQQMSANNADTDGAWRTLDATQPGQDGQRVRVIGDFCMEIRDSKTHMARLTNIAT